MDKLPEIEAYVSSYMSQYDGSHDFSHVKRVLGLAQKLEKLESERDPMTTYNSDIITLAAMLHDVGDRKYLKPGEDGTVMVEKLLLSFNVDSRIARDVQSIVNHVSYSNEIKHREEVQRCLKEYPELAIVQDADRLDAIGAVGVARCFTYNAAHGYSMPEAIEHFKDKLEKLEGMMKTVTGKQMAAVRTKRIIEFRQWWEEELTIAGVESD